jgi:AcrR family transcriptional regulator
VYSRKLKNTDMVENRRNEIIDAALKLFANQGYHSTTLDAVASEIGVTKAALYYYFRNKEEIIRVILNRSTDRMKQILRIGKSSLSAKEKLRQFIIYHVIYGADNTDLAKIAFEQLNILPKRSREVHKRKQREVVTFLQDLLQQGINDGIVAVDDTKVVAFAILGMCNWSYHWYKLQGKLTPNQIADIFINLLENGYLIKPPSPGE